MERIGRVTATEEHERASDGGLLFGDGKQNKHMQVDAEI